MSIVQFIFYFLGLIVSIAFIAINKIIDNSWGVIVLIIILMTPFCCIFYFALDKYINKKNLKYIYIANYVATISALIICLFAFMKHDFISAGSQSYYIAVYLSFVIYTIFKKQKMKREQDS
jgi:ABC-type multidrug transport system permease subunit